MRRYFRGRMLQCRADAGAAVVPDYLHDGILIIDNERIVEMLPAAQALQQGVRPEQCRKLGNKLLVPGFIDAHVHAYQLDMIASYGEQLLQWLDRYTYPAEARMSDVVKAAEVAGFFLQQLLQNGTTSAMVFSTSHKAATDLLFSQAAELGLCLITGKTLMDRNAPAELLDDPELAYSESAQLIEKWHRHRRLHYAVTPRFALTSSAEQLSAAGKLLQRWPDLYVQTHLSENQAEVALVKQLFPESRNYLDVYDRHGLCTDRSVFAHGVHLADAEIARLHSAGSAVACCPTSNLFLGSGLFDWQRLREGGVRLAVGTDVGGGTSYSMLETLRDLYKVNQLKGNSFRPLDGFHAITLGNARALQLGHRLGHFGSGCDADFVILDPDADALVGRRVAATQDIADEWFVYMTLGSSRLVSETWAAGRRLYRNPLAVASAGTGAVV